MRGKLGVVAIVVFLLATQASATETIGNITVYGPHDVLEFCDRESGAIRLRFPGSYPYRLADQADTRYFPMDVDEVMQAIEGIDFPVDEFDISVLILPAPRLEITESSAEGNVIFLSPGRLPYSPEHIHYTVTHEIGHVVHNLFMPDNRLDLWREYARIRGIDFDEHYRATVHCNRLHEIFAEDFRFLFGDQLACYSGTIENHELELPDAIPGLKEFFLSLPQRSTVRSVLRVFPSPFSESTSIVTFGVGADPDIQSLEIFDIRGRLVRKVPGGTRIGNAFMWDGTDGHGRKVAAGTYLIIVRTATENLSAKVLYIP